MNRLTLSIFAAIICLIGSTYGDNGDDEDVVSRQRRETTIDPNGLALGVYILIAVVVLSIIVIVICCYCCACCPCYKSFRPNSTTNVTIVQAPAGNPGNNGQNNFGIAQPYNLSGIHQGPPSQYNNQNGYTRLVNVPDCESGYVHPR